ncbi:ParB/RepB/Spo0J family partition protein [Streptomyces sp. MZ04]|uniref:ParB/RepB/Spo0J family partition protein n=1 Tax=Streptomyces sp. MZ04 TaxID=2559236 RepID=UPI00107E76BC|nr:ParB/RepB/Spo0J family partition protein [Streptomyces sp. MZ04]TGB02071.1 ParB/RepB/Spo0J family partition protein [Streptomyces sp. MZ04]
MAGRRTSLATLAGQRVDNVPGQSDPLLLALPLTKLVPTRFNPRRNFGTDEALHEFGLVLKHRQLQPAVVVSRGGYLKLWPEEEPNVGDKPYVIANGERRYRASLSVGLTTLNVVHDENVASSRADFLDAVLSENNDREDLDPIERALGIETMVIELKGADKVAAHYGKTKGWVSQQRKLLKLTPELQALVSSGELAVRVGRDIASLPQGEQAAAWEAELGRRAEAKAAPRKRVAQPRDAGPAESRQPAAEVEERFTAVNQPAAAAPESNGSAQEAERFTAVNRPAAPAPASNGSAQTAERFTAVNNSAAVAAASEAAEAEPEVATTSARGRTATLMPHQAVASAADSLPWGEPLWFDQQLRKHMSKENRDKLVWLLQASDED